MSLRVEDAGTWEIAVFMEMRLMLDELVHHFSNATLLTLISGDLVKWEDVDDDELERFTKHLKQFADDNPSAAACFAHTWEVLGEVVENHLGGVKQVYKEAGLYPDIPDSVPQDWEA